jgi:hypothetical protein
MERYLRVYLLGPGPRLMKKRIYRAAVSQRLRNTGLDDELLACQGIRSLSGLLAGQSWLRSFHLLLAYAKGKFKGPRAQDMG